MKNAMEASADFATKVLQALYQMQRIIYLERKLDTFAKNSTKDVSICHPAKQIKGTSTVRSNAVLLDWNEFQ